MKASLQKDFAATARELTEKLRAQVSSGDTQGALASLDQMDAVSDVASDADNTVANVALPPSSPSTPSLASAASSVAPSTPSASAPSGTTDSSLAQAATQPSPATPPATPTPSSSSVTKGAIAVGTPPPPVGSAILGSLVGDVIAKSDDAFLDDPVAELFGTGVSGATMAKQMPQQPVVLATPPPNPQAAPFSFYGRMGDDFYIQEKLPAFTKALLTGGRFASENALDLFKTGRGNYDFHLFDMTLHAAYRQVLNKGGFRDTNATEFRKMAVSAMDGNEIRSRGLANDFNKGVISTTAPGYYLQMMVKMMLPVLTPMLNRIPMQKPRTGGSRAEWRVNLGFQNLDETQGMIAPEAGVAIGSTTGTGQAISENPTLFQTPYSRHPVNDAVTVEAQYAMLGYDDAFQYSIVRALTAYLRIAEMATLWNNYAAVGAIGAVTATTSGSSSALAGGTNDKFAVTGLTGIGWRGNQLGIGGKGGASSVQGETAATLTTATDLSTATSVKLTFAAKPGCLAYNVYYLPSGVVGNARYVGTYYTNAITITALPAVGAAKSYPTADGSANANGYEGALQWCEMSTIYGNSITNKTVTDQAGAALTLAGPNRISEIDKILADLMTNWQLAPSLIVGSPNTIRHFNNILQSGGSAQPYIIHLGAGPEQGSLVGGMWAGAYTNNYSLGLQNVPKVIDVMAHPYLADGTLMVMTETIPYPMAREARGWVIEQQIPLTYWPLAALTASWPYMMFSDQVLENYHPPAQAAIQCINTA